MEFEEKFVEDSLEDFKQSMESMEYVLDELANLFHDGLPERNSWKMF